ncbi:hypothetical protein KDA00_02875 [Candidatus Saccharibacteria bacterium]|nr:hypothetical protein [Candidatus Saccharibacteria bacterium]
MKHLSAKLKFIIIDSAGVLLIILAGLTGWLPGPGGIPLLIAGLGLLSINHKWAKRWLMYVKNHGVKISDKLFNGSPTITIVIDVIGVIFLAIAVYLITEFTRNITKTAGVWLVIVALILLLGNRQRLKNFMKKR